MAKHEDLPQTNPEEIEPLMGRPKQTNIAPRGLDLVKRLLRLMLILIRILQMKNASLNRLKRMIFGPGSDRRTPREGAPKGKEEANSDESPEDSPAKPSKDAKTCARESEESSKDAGNHRRRSKISLKNPCFDWSYLV